MGEIATTRSRRATSSSRMPGTARIGPIETSGFDGAITTISALRSASITPGAGRADSSAHETHRRHGHVVLASHEVLLEAELALAVDRESSLDLIVGHGDEPQPESPRPGDLGGDLGQRRSLGHAVRAIQVRGEVSVAEPEPRCARRRSQRPDVGIAIEGAHRLPGLADESPARLRIDRAGQRVDHRVEVGTDAQPVHHDVVAGVDDGGDLCLGTHLHQPAEKAGRAHTAG